MLKCNMRCRVLLINPWIYDFAAFDLWARPLGLLYLAAWLGRHGIEVRLVDCMDRLHPQSQAPPPRKIWPHGTGQWFREKIITPAPLKETPRQYSKYGLSEDVFRRELLAGPKPDAVMVTSIMTYWYPGAHRAVALARSAWPDVPIVLGGVYATLCPEHAKKFSGADLVISGPVENAAGELAGLVPGLADLSGNSKPGLIRDLWPDLSLYPRLEYAPLATSRGCPRGCPYCASKLLFPGFVQREVDDVIAEMEDRVLRLGLEDFVFFDDALLEGAEKRIIPILEEVIRRNWSCRFHTPNGLHVGSISRELAELMWAAGFQTIRLGLESLDIKRQIKMGEKVAPGRFEKTLVNLVRAGFDPKNIGVYIMYGLPGQPMEEVLSSARTIKALGARPYLAEFSPLPGTPFWKEALAGSPYDLEKEPLYQNNTFFPCRPKGFSWDEMWKIKRTALS